MPCGDFPLYRQFWYEGQFLDAVYCPFADQLGVVVVGLMVFGALGIGMYISSGTPTVPITVAIILAAVVFVQLPAGAVQFAGIAIVFALGVIGYLIVQRLDTV